MKCSDVCANLSAFIDHELDEAHSTAIKAHLIRCPECRKQRDELESLGRSIRNIPPLTAPPHFEFDIYSKIRNLSGRCEERRWRWNMILIPAAAMVIGVFIGLFHAQHGMFPFGGETAPAVAEVAPPVKFTSLSPVVATDDGIREYTIDHYVPGRLVPRTVAAIPDEEDQQYESGSTPDDRGYSNRNPVPDYVLDRIPMQAGYERTIY